MAHQAGSAADLERLMEEYGTGLLRLCALHLGDAALAEDAAQETLLRAWRRYGTFRGEAAERTWITAIAWRRFAPTGIFPMLQSHKL